MMIAACVVWQLLFLSEAIRDSAAGDHWPGVVQPKQDNGLCPSAALNFGTIYD